MRWEREEGRVACPGRVAWTVRMTTRPPRLYRPPTIQQEAQAAPGLGWAERMDSVEGQAAGQQRRQVDRRQLLLPRWKDTDQGYLASPPTRRPSCIDGRRGSETLRFSVWREQRLAFPSASIPMLVSERARAWVKSEQVTHTPLRRGSGRADWHRRDRLS